MNLSIAWAQPTEDPYELSRFFVSHTSPEYISHGEIQDGRAESAVAWSDDLHETIYSQYSNALKREADKLYSETRLALVRTSTHVLVGLAYIGIQDRPRNAYAVLYDLVVHNSWRSKGVGTQLLEFVESELKGNIAFLFLESGISNARAHQFFEREGFSVTSLVMAKRLTTS